MQFIAGSGSCHDPIYKIEGGITHHVKDKNRKYFVSAEFIHELYTPEFWNDLSDFAKTNKRFIELYSN